MKTIVVTDEQGKVTGLVRFEEVEDEGVRMDSGWSPWRAS